MIRGRARLLPGRALADVVLAASACAVDVYMFSDAGGADSSVDEFRRTVGYALIGFLILLLRRRAPLVVFALIWVYALMAAPGTGSDFLPTAGPGLAMFTVASHRPTRTSVATLLAWEVLAVIAGVREANTHPAADWANAFVATSLYNLLLYAGVWAVGRDVRLSRRHAADLEFRRRVEAEQAVTEERTRIARELHDIVSHAVTVMVLQAAGARRTLTRDPEKADRSLNHIEGMGEQAMGELRRMLTALRPTGGQDDGRVEAPAVDAAGLRGLVEPVEATGVRVELVEDGDPRPLAPSVGLAVYRVVQEALTNVTKHAGPGATARVRLAWTDDAVDVSVTDDGRGGRPHRAGALSAEHGLRGLRERVAIAGGRLDAGPVPDGGFAVCAWLPVSADERAGVAL